MMFGTLFESPNIPLASDNYPKSTVVMPSGKGEGFTGAQGKFMDDLVPAFLAKTAHRKPVTPGDPLPTDDSDLSAWITERLREFEAKFANELTAPGAKAPTKIREVSGKDSDMFI